MNQTDVNNLLNNSNSADLFGRRVNGLSTVNNLSDLNELLAGDDLPQIVVYDKGYLNDRARSPCSSRPAPRCTSASASRAR